MYTSTPPSPEVENFQIKIFYSAGDRTLDLLNQRQTCYRLSQHGELFSKCMIFFFSGRVFYQWYLSYLTHEKSGVLDEIIMLPKCWDSVIEKQGDYIEGLHEQIISKK